jgi:predicted GNAT family acetyltransferase
MAPFVAVASRNAGVAVDLSRVVEPDERFYLVGPAPTLSSAWEIEKQSTVLQMIWAGAVSARATSLEIRVLSERDSAAMVELTTLAFPGFFRPRTPQMGRYLGIFDADRLVAMAGERMRTQTHQEISAVCTHPQFTGRGYARSLVNRLIDESLQRGDIPFLHVSESNVHAKELYERMGFVVRTRLPLRLVRRIA